MRGAWAGCLLVLLVLLASAGCGGPETTGQSPPSLRKVALPDLSPLVESVRTQLTEQDAVLAKATADAETPRDVLGGAYGEMGRLLMAARFHDAAEPYYLNAEALAPGDFRWPYLLGHLYQASGDLDQSASAFERALRLRPDDVAALFWLGDARLDQNRPGEAAPLFERARAVQPGLAAAEYGLGRVALARENYTEAVRRLEDALTQSPQASAIHYPLALAYRGLGDTAAAETHLRQRGDVMLPLPDPLMAALSEALNSAQALETRGQAAVRAGDWPAAVRLLRQAAALAPENPSPRHGLATALLATGDVRGAVGELQVALTLSPRFAGARLSLGMLLASAGRDGEAIAQLRAAVRDQGDRADVHQVLGDLLRRSGRSADSLAAYQRALELDPQSAAARFGHAIALVRLGRYREARDGLSEGMTRHPERSEFALALARVLAASPDARVRDGARARSIADRLARARSGPGLEVGETMAMALAELRQFNEAIRVQRDVLAGLDRIGRVDLAVHVREDLRGYEQGRPRREPWRASDLIYFPGPQVDPSVARALEGVEIGPP